MSLSKFQHCLCYILKFLMLKDFSPKKNFQYSDSEHKSVRSSDPVSLRRTRIKSCHKAPSQRYEYNLVNAAVRGLKKKLLEALEVVILYKCGLN